MSYKNSLDTFCERQVVYYKLMLLRVYFSIIATVIFGAAVCGYSF